ncbi:MAG: 1,4-dihydroxy-2-naphthoate polyprenyltransferase [Bifidobacteriaceae bacterium]|jgi:1,4-dihydroxy-2-naphthoate octaprenyltransferase|nr:1,4-dihydroxy-2-naphthoate polyprenyltransferase [Bifidobacteriaceae bacterium]
MATVSQWVEGIRLRTLPASIAPVLVGVGAAWQLETPHWGRAGLALLVALALQIGANLANDYSDGVRGTDQARQGPQRLVASGAASPGTVKLAALVAFAVAAAAGVGLTAWTGQWWLLGVGALALLAAWFYTGGKRPYGYMALGDISVFLFFGVVPALGTCYTQHLYITWRACLAAAAMGLMACGILMANNLRDIHSDQAAGKITLAVKLGERVSRVFYAWEMWLAIALGALCAIGRVHVLIVLLMAWPTARLTAMVAAGAKGDDLVRVLRITGQVELCFAILLGLALANVGLFGSSGS